MELDQTRTRAQRTEAPAGRAYLLVFEGDTSRVLELPPTTEVFVGRASDCQVRVADDGASRRHCRIDSRAGQLWLTDLGSHNGTFLNGRRVAAEIALSPGDSIVVSDVTLVVHCGARPVVSRTVLTARAFRERLAGELERALQYEHPFCLASLRLAQPAAPALEAAVCGALRLMDAAAHLDDALVVLLPEVEPPDAAAAVERLVEAAASAGGVLGAGLAVFPADGADAETLLLAARQAATAARDGALESADQTVRRLELEPGRVVLVADPAVSSAYALVERLARATLPVLVLGETGVGKENAARAVHAFSPRKSGPFVSINCAGLPDTLLESELFGYERGAFSGATNARPGLFEAAHGGTVFLDEVGELSPTAQARLLRVLETKAVTRLGSVKEKQLDVRVVAATHRDLAADVRAGRFREDLYFRLSAAIVHLPPLRERPRELGVLAREFAANAARAAGRQTPQLSVALMGWLTRHDWPGNVRELKNTMEFAVATAPGSLLEPQHLPRPRPEAAVAPVPVAQPPRSPDAFTPLAIEVRDLERRRIKEALAAANGVQTRAAELLSMPRRTFVLRLRELRLTGEPV